MKGEAGWGRAEGEEEEEREEGEEEVQGRGARRWDADKLRGRSGEEGRRAATVVLDLRVHPSVRQMMCSASVRPGA